MTRTVIVGEVRTGRRIATIPVADASWSSEHRGEGSVVATIPLEATDFEVLEKSYVGGIYPGPDVLPGPDLFPEAPTPVWRPGQGLRAEFLASLEPIRCFMGVLETPAKGQGQPTILEAGPIWTWDYQDATGTLTVGAKGMRSLLGHRIVIGEEAAAAWAQWAATLGGLSMRTIQKRLVQMRQSVTGGGLPIDFEDDIAGDNTRTYNGYSMASVRQRLEEVEGVIDGPDAAFSPRLSDDRLGVRWDMRTGDPLLTQDGDDWTWDTRVPRSGVSDFSVKVDASAVAQHAWVTGDGMEESLQITRATPADVGAPDLRDHGYPLMERVESRPTAGDEGGSLTSWARGYQRQSLRPWVMWSLTVDANTPPRLGRYRCGDWARIWVQTKEGRGIRPHRLLQYTLPQGFHRARILRIAGSIASDSVTVDLAPQMDAR